jgi:hypothetical protein
MCGEWFEAKHHRRLYCSTKCQNAAKRRNVAQCEARIKREKAKKVPTPKQSISDVMAYAEECRKRLGRYVSYGEAVALMDGRMKRNG